MNIRTRIKTAHTLFVLAVDVLTKRAHRALVARRPAGPVGMPGDPWDAADAASATAAEDDLTA